MSRRCKYSAELKIETVRKVLDGKWSVAQAARETGADKKAVRQWVANYRVQGFGFADVRDKNTHYPLSLKLAAVQDYLAGLGSQREISIKHGIRSTSQLRNWIKAYNNGTLKETRARGLRRVKKGRKTTLEERVEIVKFCLDHDYGLTIEEFGVSYDQIYAWVKKYLEAGASGLEDRRGKRRPIEEMSEVERLKAENERLALENMLLKKKIELRRLIYSKLREHAGE